MEVAELDLLTFTRLMKVFAVNPTGVQVSILMLDMSKERHKRNLLSCGHYDKGKGNDFMGEGT